MNAPLTISEYPGITLDSLGHYFMGLGLLRATAARWPQTRGFWRDGVFRLAGSFSEQELTGHLLQTWQPTPYRQWWSPAQKADTKAKAALQLPLERSQRPVAEVRVADSTIVGLSKNQFSPLFGTGGNIGKRNLATAWNDAEKRRADIQAADWLEASLQGKQSLEAPPFTNAGTWFVYNNKAFNSGLAWYREGALSPWSFLLAMEGALLLTGGSGRRLGSTARPYAVFPFVSKPLEPEAREEIGQSRGEFWAPVWEQPATLAEVRALLQRGLAKLGGKAASAPHEFAVAARAAGANAGIAGFKRFELRQTTSAQVYEAIPRDFYPAKASVGRDNPRQGDDASALLLEIVGSGKWLERLPLEPFNTRSKTKFSGLRGPIERAVLAVAQAPEEAERWQNLLLLLARTQGRVDRNLEWRKKCLALPLLTKGWVERTFSGEGLPDDLRRAARLAGALAALGAKSRESGARAGASSSAYPAGANLFGVAYPKFGPVFAQPGRPQRVVWHEGEPLSALLDFVGRRLVDASKGTLDNLAAPPGACLLRSDIADFLDAEEGDNPALMQRWLPALALLDWSRAALPERAPYDDKRTPSAELLRWAFFKPFFHFGELLLPPPDKKRPQERRPFFRSKEHGPKPGVARQLFSLLRHGSIAEANALACAGYRAQGHAVIAPPDPNPTDARRLALALALPIDSNDLAALVGRWIEPPKSNPAHREHD